VIYIEHIYIYTCTDEFHLVQRPFLGDEQLIIYIYLYSNKYIHADVYLFNPVR